LLTVNLPQHKMRQLHAIFVIALTLAHAGCSIDAASHQKSRKRQHTSCFTVRPKPYENLTTIDGKVLTKGHIGSRPLLLNFIAIGCQYSEPQIKEVERLIRVYGDNIVAVTVVANRDLSPLPTTDWYRKYPPLPLSRAITWAETETESHVVYDNEGIWSRYGVMSFPTLLIVDPDHKLRDLYIGAGVTRDMRPVYESVCKLLQ
jgi:hypothetical protein